jgi:hypothetical protein
MVIRIRINGASTWSTLIKAYSGHRRSSDNSRIVAGNSTIKKITKAGPSWFATSGLIFRRSPRAWNSHSPQTAARVGKSIGSANCHDDGMHRPRSHCNYAKFAASALHNPGCDIDTIWTRHAREHTADKSCLELIISRV